MSNTELLSNFCQITGASIETAANYLEMSAGNLDVAISLFFDNPDGVSLPQETVIDDINDVAQDDDLEMITEGEYNRILESQEIYRPQRVDDTHYSVSIFNIGKESDSNLSKQFDLPDNLKGPYLLEVARENALYQQPQKWILLCIFEQTDFEGATINRDLFHDSVVMELMEYNFIIVQQSTSQFSTDQSEGNRLRDVYHVQDFPFVAIVNPLTGSVEKTIYKSICKNKDRFIETITNFLCSNAIEQLPSIQPPTITAKTSNRISPVTPAMIKPLSSPEITTKRMKPSSPVTTSPAKSFSPSPSRSITTNSGPNACRMRLRLPSAVETICILKDTTMRELVDYIHSKYSDLNKIDILTGNPPTSILSDVTKTVEDLKLNGSVLIVRNE